MKKILVSLLIGAILGGVGGFALGIFLYPYYFLADIVAKEQVVNVAQKKVIATGKFIHANPGDPIHHGKGGVTVYGDAVHLNADFEVGPGPAYHVYLVPIDTVTPDTAVEKAMFVDLGRLRAFKGSQVYDIPPGLDLKKYPNVVIWCEHFSVLISPAKLVYKS
ncbi:MAG: DM13 domain-containing protein [Gammaproteobacteria bacterium]|nr:DM13 domain-containing protein [Gammaproteobacteria bacterium]